MLYGDHELDVLAKASPRRQPHGMIKNGHEVYAVPLLLRHDPFGDRSQYFVDFLAFVAARSWRMCRVVMGADQLELVAHRLHATVRSFMTERPHLPANLVLLHELLQDRGVRRTFAWVFIQ